MGQLFGQLEDLISITAVNCVRQFVDELLFQLCKIDKHAHEPTRRDRLLPGL